MSLRVFLHIGASKTGTTYLQGMCDANREALRARGVLFPAPLVDHFRFMRNALGVQDGRPPPKAARLGFDRVVAAVQRHEGVALVSNELLAAATAAQIEQVLAALAPAEVHVVYTVRDLARTLPAEWQQAVKGGCPIGLDDFVDGVIACFDTPLSEVPPVVGESHVIEKFPLLHHVVDVFARWSGYVDPSRIHVVTLPPPGAEPGVLWQRFCEATGLDPEATPNPPRRGNESVGVVEAEALRRVNAVLYEQTGYDFRSGEWVRSRFVLPVVAAHTASTRIALREGQRAWAVTTARDLVARLDGHGYDIVGDLADLMPSPEPGPGLHPGDLPDSGIAAVAVDWVARLLSDARS